MYNERQELYKQLEAARESKILAYFTGDRKGLEISISRDAQDYFVNHLDKLGNPKKISLYLYTQGGDTLAAWGLINLLKHFCDDWEVIIPSKARSAGTLIALGAKDIVMTKQATLGPIDPSLNGPLNPQNPQFPNNPLAKVPVSVETIKGYFDLAKQELNIRDEEHFADILTSLSEKVHPLVLGNVFRARGQIQMLAKKLLSERIKDEDKVKKIIDFLCSESGSHDYPIYRREATNDLGLNVVKPSMELYHTIKAIYDDFEKELELNKVYDPNYILANVDSHQYSFKRGFIETVENGSNVFISEGTLTKTVTVMPQQMGLPPLQRALIEDKRTFEGWK